MTNSYDKLITKLAGAFGLLEGLVFSVLSLICIVLYSQEPTESTNNSIIIFIFLSPKTPAAFDRILPPHVFTVFMWVYLVLDLIWTGISVFVLSENTSKPKSLIIWSCSALVLALWDVAAVIVLAIDYKKCMNWAENQTQTHQDMGTNVWEDNCFNGIVPLLVIAAKGFVLWVVNVSFSVCLIKIAIKLFKRF